MVQCQIQDSNPGVAQLVERASDSRSKDPRFERRQKHKKNLRALKTNYLSGNNSMSYVPVHTLTQGSGNNSLSPERIHTPTQGSGNNGLSYVPVHTLTHGSGNSLSNVPVHTLTQGSGNSLALI